ncbi:MAG: GNAT family N-acetyltransferase [Egibacteraceae bacterium]
MSTGAPTPTAPSPQPALLLKGMNVALGPLQRDLVPLYHRWDQDLTVLVGLGQRFPDTLESSYQSYEHASNASAREGYFTVYDIRDHDAVPYPIGTTCLQNVIYDKADFTIILGERRGQGLGTEATRLTLDWAFNIAGLRNVSLEVWAPNEAAIRAYKNAGFKEIGRRRNAARWLGQPCDMVLMDAIPEDFTGSVIASPTDRPS